MSEQTSQQITFVKPDELIAVNESLRAACESLNNIQAAGELMTFVTDWLVQYCDAAVAGLASCQEDQLLGTVLAVSASEAINLAVESSLEDSLVGSPIAIPFALRAGHELNEGHWQQINADPTPKNLGRLFGFGAVYGFAFRYAGKIAAATAIIMPGTRRLSTVCRMTVEAFLRMAGLALQRHLLESTVLSEPHTPASYTVGQNRTAVILIEQGQIVDCNLWVQEVLTVERSQLLGQDLASFLGGYAKAHNPRTIEAMLTKTLGGAEQNFEMIYESGGGIQRVVEVRLLPLRLPAGKIVVQMLADDTTERRKAQVALRESEARYRELFTTSRDGIVRTDKDDYFVDCNPAFLAMLGYQSIGELAQETFLNITPPEYHQWELEGVSKLGANHVELEKEFFHKSGRRILCWLRVWHYFDANGRPDGCWAIVRDITHQRQLEEKLLHEERSRLLGELAAAIGHEVRNPLTTVRGFLQFLPLRSDYSDRDREIFQLMLQELDSATTIIGDFLDLARPERTQMAPLALDELLRSLMRVMETKAIMQHVEVSSTIQSGLLVAADGAQLRQVFVNLLQNALQAMPEGGRLTIEATVQQEDSVLVEVIDTGVGISKENLERIGKPFFTTKPGGTGLGLVTCFRIIRANGGKIQVASSLGEGTTFTVVLPLASQ